MPLFQKGRKKTGGRKRGTPNKKTLSRIAEAEQVVASGKKGGRKLAVDVLGDYMALFSALASTSRDDEAKFEKYALLAVEVAAQLASYQTPKLKAVFIPDPGQQRSNGEERISRQELE